MLSDISLPNWREADDRSRVLQVIQPGLIGLIDGTLSTLAPIFAAAYVSGSRAALLVGIAAALGAAISMGLSEALSDDGSLTGRGESVTRGAITGVATFVGGTAHALPFLIGDLSTALKVAYVVVAIELTVIAWVRKRFLKVSMRTSLIQVTLGGIVIAAVGVLARPRLVASRAWSSSPSASSCASSRSSRRLLRRPELDRGDDRLELLDHVARQPHRGVVVVRRRRSW